MTLEAGKEMDKRCVLNWLYELYIAPSRAFDEYAEDELKMLALDAAIFLLKEQEAVPAIQREIMNMPVWCCGSCGVAITDGDKFCRMCGRAVKWNDK